MVSSLRAFQPECCMHFTSSLSATLPSYLFLLDLVILMILGDEYKLCSSSLGGFLQCFITSFLLGRNVVHGTLMLRSSLKPNGNTRIRLWHFGSVHGMLYHLYVVVW
jgi:hypothetical protein